MPDKQRQEIEEVLKCYNKIREYCEQRVCEGCIFQGSEDSSEQCIFNYGYEPNLWDDLEF